MRFVALWLAAAALAVFALQQVVGTEPLLLIKSQMWQEPWRILTSIFAHASAQHILSNLFGLVLFGLLLEGRVGPRRTLFVFFAVGILVNFFTIYERSLGASGAIFGLIGVLVVLRPFMTIWSDFMPMPMILGAVLWFAKDYIGLFLPDGVANAAHMGGLALGLAIGFYYRRQGFGDRISFQGKKRDPHLEKEIDEWEERYMRPK